MTTLRGITWDHPRGYDPLVAAAAQWERETGVQVQWTKRSLQDFADVPISRLAADYDLVVIDHPHVGQLAEDGSVMALPMPEPLAGATVGKSAESYIWRGRCYAYAIDAACQMAVKQVGAAVPVARHWEEFLADDAAKFRAVTPLKPVDAFDALLTFAAGMGEPVPSSPDSFIARPAMERGLHLLRALFRLGPSDAVLWNPIHVLELLASGESEFAQSPCLFGYVNYVRPGFRPRRLEYVDLPVFADHGLRSGILGGAGIAVSARCPEPEAALAHAAWLASDAVQSGVYTRSNGQPAATAAWDDGAKGSDAAGFFAGGRSTIDTAWTRPRDEWFLGFVDDACEIMPDFFLNDIPVETFADALDKLYRHHCMEVAV